MLIEKLSALSGLSQSQIELIETTASSRYFHFRVRKRSGDWRDIYHPARELKSIQKWLNKAVLSKFSVNKAATAYEKGASIRKNAALHAGTRFTSRFDFQDFFPSFKEHAINAFLAEKAQQAELALDARDIEFFTNIACRDGGLSIGAPSSPILTNRMMNKFDTAIVSHCEERGLIYSRYADDLFVSSFEGDMLKDIKELIELSAKELAFPKLKLNSEKTAYLSKKRRRVVTGLVLTTDGKVSLGRHRKRLISAAVHHAVSGKLDKYETSRLSGMLAFCFDAEPTFYDSLCTKYGTASIEKIRGLRSVSLKDLDKRIDIEEI